MDQQVAVLTQGATGTRPDAPIPQYYSRKTRDILHKYGPGPRVHFHLGLFAAGETPTTTNVPQHVIRQRLVASQEALVERAAGIWGVPEHAPRSILDIGCGVGGGSLYWAQEYGTRVTALTVAADHIPVIEDFAQIGSVNHLVLPRHQDIHTLTDVAEYDAAVAFESSGYMDRERLFEVVARSLRPGGWFGIQEHFLRRPEWAEFIDGYYKTRLGTLTEYILAARAAGFELEQDEDITDGVTEFWVQSMAWTAMELERTVPERSVIDHRRLTESALTHGKFMRLWRDRGIETRILMFRLKAHR